jgi:hypothetical protein
MDARIRVTIGALLVAAAAGAGSRALYNRPPKQQLDVPFTSQAPAGNWLEPWQNACEETSVIMVTNFFKGDELTVAKAREQILHIFSLKNSEFGKSHDESMSLIAEVVNGADLGWTARVVDNPSLEDLKLEIAAGRPIVVPVDARQLIGTDYAGEVKYHVMVISGYDDVSGQFIVQDPGTSEGENFRYGYADLYDAIHDYLQKDIAAGTKRVIFTTPRVDAPPPTFF